ncbi:LacI family DNA-binding transcriptional regulator [Tritonibacter horizontis]|uniref:HTH-type transcriptional regulator DegA n=1 Tax=Tritonibacter horizontis TaxID=1768241 RepID=A0A132BYY4_9RHOB|nr:LacI family DNA-binding transcriptional regulator [Tritonibacter horizontis]KUP92960.1 HTH-type transcriptional regulator DegA [Tritonibacter horizontis]
MTNRIKDDAPLAASHRDAGAVPAAAPARVTLADIARAAGVSRMTVSNALNNRTGVSREMRKTIQHVAKDLGYVTNWAAKKLSDTRSNAESGIVGVIAELHTPYMAEIAGAISSAVRDCHRDMLVYSLPEPGRDLPGNVLDLLLDSVDGVISVLPRESIDLPALIQARVPVVAVDPLAIDDAVPWVAGDNYQGAQLAVRHLIALGHREIAFLAGEDDRYSARERLRAFRDTMAEAGLEVRADRIIDAKFLQELGRSGTENLLQSQTPPTAIFAANDVSALGAMTAIQAAGLSVPHDISLIGFDDLPLARQMLPGLTTIRQPYPEIGRAAVRLLFEIKAMGGQTPPPGKHILLPVWLIERGSTARLQPSKPR